jgi:hypothetical protein
MANHVHALLAAKLFNSTCCRLCSPVLQCRPCRLLPSTAPTPPPLRLLGWSTPRSPHSTSTSMGQRGGLCGRGALLLQQLLPRGMQVGISPCTLHHICQYDSL